MGDVIAGVGLGYREGAVQLTSCDGRQITAFEFLAAVMDDRAHPKNREVDSAGGVHRPAGSRHLPHQQRGFGDAQTTAAVLFRDGDSKIASLCDGMVKLMRKFVAGVLLPPILIREVLAEGLDLADDLFLRGV